MAIDPKLVDILNVTSTLSAEDKIQLIRNMTEQLQHDLKAAKKPQGKSLRGLWKGIDISEEEIDKSRKEAWGNFPRESI